MSNVHASMGRRSKAVTSRINNLAKARKPQSPTVTVEDVEGEEDKTFEDNDLLKEGFFSWTKETC